MSTDLTGARVLVTGASGFIGGHLVAALVRQGCHVCGAGRRPRSDLEIAVEPQDWRVVDLTDRRRTARLLTGEDFDLVFHLASRVTGSRERSEVWPMVQANLLSTVHLLDACAEAGTVRRLVLAGSLEEGDSLEELPASPYAAAKTAATLFGRLYDGHYGLPVSLARIFMVYGPGPQDTNKLVPYVIRGLLGGAELRFSGGGREVDWIFVEDVAAGLLALAESDCSGVRVDLGTGRLASVREVVERLYADLAPERRPEFGGLGDRRAERVARADVEASDERIGWRPAVSLEEGLARTVEWFRSRGDAASG